jgi:hypothetical protein
MKSLTFALALILIIGAMAFGSGKGDTEEVSIEGLTINYGRQGPDWPNEWFAENELAGKWQGKIWGDYLGPKFTEETGINVTVKSLPEGDNTVKVIDTYLASDDPPDIVYIYGGKTAKYGTKRYAVNMRDYLPDAFFDQFIPSAIAQFNPKPDEVIRILPASAWIVTGTMNADLAREIGSYVPAKEASDRSWTLEQFEDMARKARDAGKYATYIPGSSGGYDILGWYAAFGATLFDENGNLAINSAEGIAAAKYMKWLDTEQFAWPGSAQNTWGDSIQQFQNTKEIVFISGTPGRGNKYFDFEIIEYPRAPGVDKVPVMSGADAWIVFDNKTVYGEEKGEAKIRAAIKLLQAWAGREGVTHHAQLTMGRVMPFPNDVWENEDRIFVKHGVAMMKKNGIFDMAMGSPFYNIIRRNLGTAHQSMFTRERTPKEALDWFVKETEREMRY